MISHPNQKAPKPKMRQIPGYGDLYTMDEFLDMCSTGLLAGDSIGYYANPPLMSDIQVNDQCFAYRTDFSHVMWFNK